MFIEPVFGKKFFGREEVLGTLQKRVTDLKGGYRQNLALAGPMLTGKSSILRHFLKHIKDPEIVPLYLEMDGDDFYMFCRRFMAALLYRYLKFNSKNTENEGVETGRGEGEFLTIQGTDGDLESLKENCRKTIPSTTGCIDKICQSLKKKKTNDAYERLLSLTSVFKQETDKNCIVILDEFHNLSNFRLRKPFQTFGKFIMVQKNTMYIVSSSQKTLLKDILSQKLSLLFGNFEVIEIEGFDNHTARSFISDKIKTNGEYSDIIDYMIQVSQGNPFYLEMFANRFSELIKTEGLEATECFFLTFAQLMYLSEGILNQYFTNSINFFLEKNEKKTFIPLLIILAQGANTIKEIQEKLGKTDKTLGEKLQRLQDMDLIFNSGMFYKIFDKLFEYWLKYVYNIKFHSMIDDMDIKYSEFKSLLEVDYKKYIEFNSKTVEDIICDLFRSFENEKILMQRDRRKMPRFDTVKRRMLQGNIFQIRGIVGGKEWICHVKQNDIADENDIYNLYNYKAPQDSKIVRRLFIPLKGIDQNAFLLAKEQNIWVWDVQLLNVILRLFGKFELVL
ncbi:MAG: ATP-binding protein [Candidatus Omnitrophota bacterium]